MKEPFEPSQNPPESGSPSDSSGSASDLPTIKGRGARIRPSNRFERISLDLQLADLDDDYLQTRSSVRTEYYLDDSRSVVTENDSPDISYRYSLNPYRGCAHGCPNTALP